MDLDFKPENTSPISSAPPNQSPASQSVPAPSATGSPGPQPAPMVGHEPTMTDTISAVKGAPVSFEPPVPTTPPPKKRSLLPFLLIILFLALIGGGIFAYIQFFSPNSTSQSAPETQAPDSAATSSSSETTRVLPSTTTQSGRDSQRKEDLVKIQTMVEAYFVDSKSYPIVATVEKLNSSSSIFLLALVPKYGANLPADPLDPDFWYGYKSTDGKTYELSARLENTEDKDAVLVGSKYIYYLKK